ncbi:MAG TPA: glycosyltransferase family 2 protein [Solirubrobacteraceae bacterium]|jgi:glycosyltransferase involved in cell wall biosynthesis|nr:glycosyltransferase family 2 protein [Solirubrobacteraceae bacterium]
MEATDEGASRAEAPVRGAVVGSIEHAGLDGPRARTAGSIDGSMDERRTKGRGLSMPERPRVSVVIPTLNEARNLPYVFTRLPYRLHEVIIVDGHSEDDTVQVAQFLRPDVKIVFQGKRGKGDALRCGFEAATGEVIVMLDADGSADPAEIPLFVQALVDGADFAKGTRFRNGGGSADITRLRQLGNKCLNAAVNVLFGTSYSDLCYGYNAFWRHCLSAMNVDCTGFEVETLINIRIARAGLHIREVPSFERDRIHGQSNLRTFRDGGRVLRTILRERVRRTSHSGNWQHEMSAQRPMSGEFDVAG